ncbi:MAG: MFS transporter [Acidobacteriaceae bacterium]|nr:MFS transporter [Acidobacteriaceae bacterium]
MKKAFYGWWITAAAVVTFGLSTGLPYYNIGFFYDYFARTFGWSRPAITLGFPLAALLTIWAGPLLIHRFSPRKLIILGTGLTFIALAGFGKMTGSLPLYYLLWVIYTIGYVVSGPIPHQIIVSNWFRAHRGKAMGIVYVGVGIVGALGSYLVKPLTANFGFQTALVILGALMFLAWPVALFVLRDRPAEMGQFPDGAATAPKELSVQSRSFHDLLHARSFWQLLAGSFCSIGSIGAVNFHMKFVFLDEGYKAGSELDGIWSAASIMILCSSIAGRLSIGYFADRFSKKWVMTVTYFIVAATIPLLLMVHPPETPVAFAILFGFAMGADYMLIPLMAAEQFGVNSLPRAMAVILPVNTIGQTWFPYFVSLLRDRFGNYTIPMGTVFALAMLGAIAIMLLPRHEKEDEPIVLPDAQRAAAKL